MEKTFNWYYYKNGFIIYVNQILFYNLFNNNSFLEFFHDPKFKCFP